MTYLVAQFWFPTLLASALGCAVGWMSRQEGPARWMSGWVPWGAGLFLVGLMVALVRVLPGRLGLWLELSLLLFAVYVAGCFLGGVVRMTFARSQHSSVTTLPDPAPESRPAENIVVAAEASETGTEVHPGARPVGREAPRDGRPDDLRRIKGIGRQNADRLNALGIWHFYQIAAWTPEEAAWVGSYLAFPGRIEREDWVGQAKLLARGEETEFSQRVDRGEVETSQDEPQASAGDGAKPVRKRPSRKPKAPASE